MTRNQYLSDRSAVCLPKLFFAHIFYHYENMVITLLLAIHTHTNSTRKVCVCVVVVTLTDRREKKKKKLNDTQFHGIHHITPTI